jgi:hypothetical protein
MEGAGKFEQQAVARGLHKRPVCVGEERLERASRCALRTVTVPSSFAPISRL